MKHKPEIKDYTRKEFCTEFNIKPMTLRKYLSEGRLFEKVKGKKRVIDITHPTNKKYYYNYLSKNGIPLSDKEEGERYKEIDAVTTETLRKRKIAKETEKLELQNAKIKGELIPVDLVIPLFKQFTKSMSDSYHNATENIVIMLQQKYKISDKSKVRIKAEMIDTINLATSKGVEDTLSQVDQISDEFSEKKGRGEHG